MITLQQWLQLVDYKITEGSDYHWTCWGGNVYSLDYWNGDHDGHSATITFDTKTQEVYEVQVHDMRNDRAYRMFASDEIHRLYTAEAIVRGVNGNQAWDDVDYIDLEVDADYIEKAEAIFAGKDYDTGVLIAIDFDDAELLKYMKMAHERNMTFNDFVNLALAEAITAHKKEQNEQLNS
jgi:hypothetical protein